MESGALGDHRRSASGWLSASPLQDLTNAAVEWQLFFLQASYSVCVSVTQKLSVCNNSMDTPFERICVVEEERLFGYA